LKTFSAAVLILKFSVKLREKLERRHNETCVKSVKSRFYILLRCSAGSFSLEEKQFKLAKVQKRSVKTKVHTISLKTAELPLDVPFTLEVRSFSPWTLCHLMLIWIGNLLQTQRKRFFFIASQVFSRIAALHVLVCFMLRDRILMVKGFLLTCPCRLAVIALLHAGASVNLQINSLILSEWCGWWGVWFVLRFGFSFGVCVCVCSTT
jgi:hypothetical protein